MPVVKIWNGTDWVVPGAISDHNLLTNRDAEDAHPIESITLLPEELAGKKKFSGFENRTDSEFVTTNLVASGLFSIKPVPTSFNVWTDGDKWTISAEMTAVTISADKTITFVYIDTDGALKASITAWDLGAGLQAPVAIIFKDGSSYRVTDERHAWNRNPAWHRWAHVHIGAMYNSGLTGVFTDTTFSITQGSISDEDIDFDTGASKTTCSLWYRDGTSSSMRLIAGSATPYKSNSGVLQYDNAGVPTDADANKYVSSWIYCSNDASEPIYTVIGQAQHTTLSAAENESPPEIRLSTAEWKLLYHVVFRNTSPITYIKAIDFRQVQTGAPSVAVVTDHASLINRDAANSHPVEAIDRALIPEGKAGGQEIVGGTASSENLELMSTSHATKGWVGINNNVDIDPGVSGGVVFRLTNATDLSGRLQFDAIGLNSFPSLLFRKAGFSGGALDAVKSGKSMGGLQTVGWNGTGYTSNKASIFFWAVEDWSATANGTMADIRVVAPGTTTAVGIIAFHGTGVAIDQGTNAPNAKLDVNGGVKIGADTDSAGATKVGTIRYRVDGNNTYAEMCMQTGASTYAWVVLASNSW